MKEKNVRNEIDALSNEILQKLKYISFDIFDTLLSRPFAKPTDLFLHMEKELGCSGFAKARVEAERKARAIHKEHADVTLDQIYESIASIYKHLKSEELRYEYDLLYAKPEGKILYESALKLGKNVIAVSDMYLPAGFITKVLKKNGYNAISNVFVSNVEDCCKGDGRLFKRVVEKLKISSSQILHIGDNKVSDVIAPENIGIRAIHRCADVEKIYEQGRRFANFFSEISKDMSLETSLITAINAYHYAVGRSNDSLREIGYLLGGPLAVGYVLHIHQVAKKRGNDGILFVSRDGYALQQVYNKIISVPIDNYYIQASRKLILRNFVDYREEVYRRNVFDMYMKECMPGKTVSFEEFDDYANDMREWAKKNDEAYTQYIDNLNISGSKLMTVDMTTREYTSLKLLTNVLGKRIDCGMFSITFGEKCKQCAFSYAKMNWKAGDEPILMLQEQLITAPEFTSSSIKEDGAFCHLQSLPEEEIRIERYKHILAGIYDFADDYVRLTAGHTFAFTMENWWHCAEVFLKYSTEEDVSVFKKIYHDDVIRETFDPLYYVLFTIRKKDYATKKNEHEIVSEDIDRYYKKNKRHLRWIRIFIIALTLETILLLYFIIVNIV